MVVPPLVQRHLLIGIVYKQARFVGPDDLRQGNPQSYQTTSLIWELLERMNSSTNDVLSLPGGRAVGGSRCAMSRSWGTGIVYRTGARGCVGVTCGWG
jgi:hypothetical protein